MKSKQKADRSSRIFNILRKLHTGSEVRVKDLAKEFGVTSTQVRSDLEWLQQIAPLKRRYGAAELETAQNPFEGTFYQVKRQRCPKEKRLIAFCAVRQCVHDGDQLLLDGGTQLEAFVEELVACKRAGIRVITQAASIALHFLNSSADFVQLGGVLNPRPLVFLDGKESFGTENFFAETRDRFLDRFCLGRGKYKAVISGTAFSCDGGLMVNSSDIVQYKHVIINAASEVIILIDHSKFFETARDTVTFCGLKPDPWLNTEKPAAVIVDSKWDDRGEAQDFKRFIESKALQEERLNRREFPHLRMFRTRLLPLDPREPRSDKAAQQSARSNRKPDAI